MGRSKGRSNRAPQRSKRAREADRFDRALMGWIEHESLSTDVDEPQSTSVDSDAKLTDVDTEWWLR